MTDQKKDEPEGQKERYISRTGFVEITTRRGIFEVRPVLDIVEPLGGIICGGYVRFMAAPGRNPKPAGDVDIYCEDGDIYEHIKEALDAELVQRHENEISITYKTPDDEDSPLYLSPVVQLIKPVKEGRVVTQGDLEEILSNFDFTVIRAGLIPGTHGKRALVDADFDHDERKHRIRIKNIHCPISSVFRIIKYAKKGYWCPVPEVARLFLDWNTRGDEYQTRILDLLMSADLTDAEVFELERLLRID
jgi:hypothetical protein